MSLKIVQFGLRYSPNLGDGVISDCLEHAVARQHPEARFVAVDLSGRRARGDVTVRGRSAVLRTLALLPAGLRRRLVAARLGRMLDALEPEWAEALEGADLAIIGGGQLFSDADLNFCMKIARAAAVIGRAGCPAVIHGAGVARNWSPEGRALFARLGGADLRLAGLRDGPSIDAWRAQMPAAAALPDPVLTRDPGLLAAACYGPAPARTDRIGLCVTAPEILRYHADAPAEGADPHALFAETALALTRSGRRVTLFCNGAVEDAAALARLARRPELGPAIEAGGVVVAPPPPTPAALAHLIAGCAGIVAHRLHACILGYAYRLPVVGLGWDRKVESFFESVGLADRHLPTSAPAEAVAECLLAAMAADDPAPDHGRVVAEAEAGVAHALAAGLDRQPREQPA